MPSCHLDDGGCLEPILNFGQKRVFSNRRSQGVELSTADDDWDLILRGWRSSRWKRLARSFVSHTNRGSAPCDSHRLVPRVHFTRRQAMCISGPTTWMLESAWLAVEAGCRRQVWALAPTAGTADVGNCRDYPWHGEARGRGRGRHRHRQHSSCPGPEMQ